MSEQESILEFPCKFPIKAMGRKEHDIERLVVDLVGKHAPNSSGIEVKTNISSNAKFISVTVSITAENRKQLDAIYQELTGHPQILYVL